MLMKLLPKLLLAVTWYIAYHHHVKGHIVGDGSRNYAVGIVDSICLAANINDEAFITTVKTPKYNTRDILCKGSLYSVLVSRMPSSDYLIFDIQFESNVRGFVGLKMDIRFVTSLDLEGLLMGSHDYDPTFKFTIYPRWRSYTSWSGVLCTLREFYMEGDRSRNIIDCSAAGQKNQYKYQFGTFMDRKWDVEVVMKTHDESSPVILHRYWSAPAKPAPYVPPNRRGAVQSTNFWLSREIASYQMWMWIVLISAVTVSIAMVFLICAKGASRSRTHVRQSLNNINNRADVELREGSDFM